MKMDIIFAGQKKVNAVYEGFTICTDQPEADGGENSAPSPFDFFISSIGTCAGYYVLSFCEKRKIPIEGIQMTLDARYNEDAHRLESVGINLHLPPTFPNKYQKALERTVAQCSVKKAILNPPEFSITANIGDA